MLAYFLPLTYKLGREDGTTHAGLTATLKYYRATQVERVDGSARYAMYHITSGQSSL